MVKATFQRADPSTQFLLAELMGEFNREHGCPSDAGRTTRLLTCFLDHPEMGCAWLIFSSGELAGYLVLCHGFSFEHGGRDAWVDEIYVRPSWRRKGLARAALAHATHHCLATDICALHLEVENTNVPARRLYEGAGFDGASRMLLTWKPRPAPDG